MTIINSDNNSITIYVTQRQWVSSDDTTQIQISIVDEDTNTVVVENHGCSITNESYYSTVSINAETFSLTRGHYYSIELRTDISNQLIYRGKMYFNIDSVGNDGYQINQDNVDYVDTIDTENQFIILE